MNKLIVDGKVAVIISPGFGAGWSTWSENAEERLFDPVIAQMLVDGATWEQVEKVAEERYPDDYNSVHNLAIVWLPAGTVFYVHEYDGSETIKTQQHFYVA